MTEDISTTAASILIVEDRYHTAEKFRAAIASTPGLEVCASAYDMETGLDHLHRHQPRVILVDLGLPDGSGIEIIKAAAQADWPCDCLVISVFGDETRVFEALNAGAKGYILKTTGNADIGASVLELIAGGSPMSAKIARYLLRVVESQQSTDDDMPTDLLSKRELQVITEVSKGLKRSEIADRLGISIGTVGTHIHKIYCKLGVASNVAAVREAARKGLL